MLSRDLFHFAVTISFQQARARVRRNIVAFAGICGGIVLVLVQLGFQSALYESDVRMHRLLNGEVVVIAEEFRSIYERPWAWFCDLTCAFIELLLRLLGLPRSCDSTSALGISGESTGLVLAMCRATGADTYLSGLHGRDYLETEEFRRAGVRLLFQEFSCPPYPQCWPGPFVPDLSVIDLLFNCGPESRKVLLGDRAA